MVTRNHPSDFGTPEPTESPTKRATRSSAASTTSLSNASGPSTAASAPTPPNNTRSSAAVAPTRSQDGWSHTPSNLTLAWLAVSLPLVIWDTGYVLGRPHTMPGGFLHAPIWKPYALYGKIDHVYGFEAIEERNGFTAAQGALNAVETAAYLAYLWLVYMYGQQESRQGRGAPDATKMGRLRVLSESRTLYSRMAAWAVLLGYTTAMLTFSKTVLYWLNEAFSGFRSIGHNDAFTLFFMWIVPNGAWLVFPCYMIYVFGQEILQGLENATGGSKKVR